MVLTHSERTCVKIMKYYDAVIDRVRQVYDNKLCCEKTHVCIE